MDMNLKQIQKLENELLKEVVRVCNKNDVLYYGAYGTVLGAVRHGGIIPWDDDIDIYIPENELDRFLEAMSRDLDEKYWVDFRTPGQKYRDFPRVGYSGYDTEVIHVDVFRLAGAPSDKNKQKRLRQISGRIHLINNVKRKGFKSYKGKGDKERKALLVTVFTFLIPLKLSTKIMDYYARKYPFETADYVGSSVSKTIGSIIPKAYLGKGIMIKYEDFEIRVPQHYDRYLSHMYRDYNKYPPIEEREVVLNRIYHTSQDQRTGIISVYYKN